MTDLNSLVIFAKVVEVKSFSEAAQRLNIPISTVSRRIADLEDQLGVRLLERSTRNLRLTEVGSEVLEHAQRSVEISDAADNVVSNQLSSVSGVLGLSAPPSISDSLLAPLVGAFQASYPNVRADLRHGSVCRSHCRRRRSRVTNRRAEGFLAGGKKAAELPATTGGEPCLSRFMQSA
jgi:DNA-binding transcriptional LysR family regulator